jgi:TorA maturation chaperone TorD
MRITGESVVVPEPGSIENFQLGEAMLRHTLYRYLASLHLYPYRNRLVTLQNVSLELQHDGPHWSDSSLSDQFTSLYEWFQGMNEESFTKVEEEYVALFTVNPIAPPYESYYQDPEGFVRSWIGIHLENLGKWYSQFAQAVMDSPAKSLYNHTVDATNMFLRHEQNWGHETKA